MIKTARCKYGLSLPELMIVLAIIATLSIYAVPSYHYYIRRGHRLAVCAAIYRAAQAVEQIRAERGDLITDKPLSLPAGLDQSPPDAKAVYRLYIRAQNEKNGGYTIEAVPVESGPMSEDECGSYLLDANGCRSNRLGGAPSQRTSAQCWQTG